MQAIKILYFASLRELIGAPELSLEVSEPMDAASVWHVANPTVALPESSLVAINQAYAGLDSMVAPGDEVAFFPPVTGG
ncbi:MAG: MoaD/ThiS family protein [Leucothrix sp.]